MGEIDVILRPERWAEPVVFVSDLHLGHDHSVIEDVEQFAPLFREAGTVVFNGDTFEPRSRQFREKSRQMESALGRFLAERKITPIYLTGNHDCRHSEHHGLALAEDRIVAVHGDFLLRYISPWSRKLDHCRDRIDALYAGADADRLAVDFDYRLEVCRRACDLLEVVDQAATETPWQTLQFYARELWPPTRVAKIGAAWLTLHRDAHAAMRQYLPRTRVLFIGHNHRPGVWRRGDRWVVNTGGYLRVVSAAAGILRDGELEVFRVASRGSRFHWGHRLLRLSASDLGVK